MRVNKYVALCSGLSRRAADAAISQGRVHINGTVAQLGDNVNNSDKVYLDGKILVEPTAQTIMLNKPAGYVCSRLGQGSKTVYDLLPEELKKLKTVGRLDKESSGLLLLSSDGELINRLTHPRFEKNKQYLIKTDRAVSESDLLNIRQGVSLTDGISRFSIEKLADGQYQINMKEGRNRQIRRTLEKLGYRVTELHRVEFAGLNLGNLKPGAFTTVTNLLK